MGSIKGIKFELALADDLSKEVTANSISRKDEAISLANFYRQKAVKARTLIKELEPLKVAAKTLGEDSILRKLASIELNLNEQIKTGEKNDTILRSIS
jgi:hypothetical protein